MSSICGNLRKSFFGSIFRFSFATAAKPSNKKAAANKNVKPEKQKFMKKQKLAASKDMAATRRSGGNDRAVPYARALFTIENKCTENFDSEEVLRREMIAKSWSRYTMLQLHKESDVEAKFLHSRIKAMKELETISPVLTERASEISYEPAPITIKPAAETKLDKLPFE